MVPKMDLKIIFIGNYLGPYSGRSLSKVPSSVTSRRSQLGNHVGVSAQESKPAIFDVTKASPDPVPISMRVPAICSAIVFQEHHYLVAMSSTIPLNLSERK